MTNTGGNGNTFQRRATYTATPRRVRHGLKPRSREGPLAENWVAQRWLMMLDAVIDDEQSNEGLVYARSGQVISLEIGEEGAIRASVQGREAQPYITTLRLPRLSESQWGALITTMAGEAIYAAKLLAHEMPPSLEQVFTQAGIDLLPARSGAIEVGCSCSIDGPCKHAAAVGMLMADRLSEHPLLLFALYGMSNERIIDRLRQARAMQTQSHGSMVAHSQRPIGFPGESALSAELQTETLPLEMCLDEFWRSGPQLAELEHAPPPQHVAHALLRRLGPSPMQGKFPLVGLLASIYDEVSRAAIHIRDRAEHLE